MEFPVRKIPEQYTKPDMAVAATFMSNPKHPTLRVRLVGAKEEKDGEGKFRMTQNAVQVRFKAHTLSVKNKKMLTLVLNHRGFNKGGAGFKIDHHDPTGFWRAAGIVESKAVQTFVINHDVKIDPTKLNIKELMAKIPDNPEILRAVT